MLTTRIYYLVRPLIPRRVQVIIRSLYIRSKYTRYRDSWPIFKEKIHPPENWNGWPGGKRFAFILTHDVETDVGQRRCRDLMELERGYGFVSSYNFVPERYKVSRELRELLVKNEFEVGVHDLKHDGKLYETHQGFLEGAKRINEYLKAWNAAGFRSGAMHHNLEWIHNLDIEYDASTFDFDPFEPQSDGLNTIFPEWIPFDGTGKGYVELPYTLPQDFTLFILMKEKNIRLWKEKLDWVASMGGMALLITHPDYMRFEGESPRFDKYPIQIYKDLLTYVKSKYEHQYWNVPPIEVARFFRKFSIKN